MQFKLQRTSILLILTSIIYLVGLIGLNLTEYRDLFLSLSATNLIFTMLILLIGRQSKHALFFLFLLICFMVGYCAEWIGVHTGYLFGDYQYGHNMGFKLFEIPLIIGLNWGLLVVCSAETIALLKLNCWISVLFSSLLMTLLDFLIEPVAIKSDFWNWEGPIPIYNYICWFLIAIPLHFLYFKWRLKEANKVHTGLFFILALFFFIQNLF